MNPLKPEEKGAVEVLKNAKLLTEQQLQHAVEDQERTGEAFRDLLFREVSWEAIKKFLNYEIPLPSGSEKRSVAAALHQAGWVSEAQLDEAEKEAQLSGQLLAEKLIEKSVITREQLETAQAQQNQNGLPLWRTLLNLGYVNARQISEIAGIGGEIAELQAGPGLPTAAASGKREDITAASRSLVQSSILTQPEALKNLTAVELVNVIVDSALVARATDIHLDPQEEHSRVRFRIDSMLYDVFHLPRAMVPEVISRLKVLGEMDFTQRRTPQEGHFIHKFGDVEADLRLESAPTVLGEKLVLRIFNEERVLTGIAKLGLEQAQKEQVEILMSRPYGMVVAAGPVGAGKTTTLYALLNEVNILSKNVQTIEDPVEYQLRGVNQMQVDPSAGFGFVEGLRSILRQDPNVIMVGEIRDEETATTAVKAAITGVLVMSTLHANDAPGTVGSLVGLNVPRFLISSALIGVVSQRLVRRICVHCKTEYQPSQAVLGQMHVPDEQRHRPFYHGKGCDQCFHTGYFGRSGVFEVMVVGDRLKDAVFRGASLAEVRQLAIQEGMQTLAQSALNKVLDGTTTPEEYLRVIFT